MADKAKRSLSIIIYFALLHISVGTTIDLSIGSDLKGFSVSTKEAGKKSVVGQFDISMSSSTF